mmetsp:Transcript_92959/g.277440  ORF Transcript_92959/g.277440 Transcript_92959/m.277440 type:complete len:202 (-) Transcript_92959:1111-1716(-)
MHDVLRACRGHVAALTPDPRQGLHSLPLLWRLHAICPLPLPLPGLQRLAHGDHEPPHERHPHPGERRGCGAVGRERVRARPRLRAGRRQHHPRLQVRLPEVLLRLCDLPLVHGHPGPLPDVHVQPHGLDGHHRARRKRDLEEPLQVRQLLCVQHQPRLHRQGGGAARHGEALGAHGLDDRSAVVVLGCAPQDLGRGDRPSG